MGPYKPSGYNQGVQADVLRQMQDAAVAKAEHNALQSQMETAAARRDQQGPQGLSFGGQYIASNPIAMLANIASREQGRRQYNKLNTQADALRQTMNEGTRAKTAGELQKADYGDWYKEQQAITADDRKEAAAQAADQRKETAAQKAHRRAVKEQLRKEEEGRRTITGRETYYDAEGKPVTVRIRDGRTEDAHTGERVDVSKMSDSPPPAKEVKAQIEQQVADTETTRTFDKLMTQMQNRVQALDEGAQTGTYIGRAPGWAQDIWVDNADAQANLRKSIDTEAMEKIGQFTFGSLSQAEADWLRDTSGTMTSSTGYSRKLAAHRLEGLRRSKKLHLYHVQQRSTGQPVDPQMVIHIKYGPDEADTRGPEAGAYSFANPSTEDEPAAPKTELQVMDDDIAALEKEIAEDEARQQ